MKILTTAKKMTLTTNQALELVDIAKCESSFDQTSRMDNKDKDGEIWTSDWGVYQISDHYWEEHFNKLGLDYKNSEDDNIEAGVGIYKESGNKSWQASKICWNKIPAGWD